MDVSIQAVSPEFGVHSVKVFASQAGGEAAVCAAACATRARNAPKAQSPRRRARGKF
jgi:hypothetical protein